MDNIVEFLDASSIFRLDSIFKITRIKNRQIFSKRVENFLLEEGLHGQVLVDFIKQRKNVDCWIVGSFPLHAINNEIEFAQDIDIVCSTVDVINELVKCLSHFSKKSNDNTSSYASYAYNTNPLKFTFTTGRPIQVICGPDMLKSLQTSVTSSVFDIEKLVQNFDFPWCKCIWRYNSFTTLGKSSIRERIGLLERGVCQPTSTDYLRTVRRCLQYAIRGYRIIFPPKCWDNLKKKRQDAYYQGDTPSEYTPISEIEVRLVEDLLLKAGQMLNIQNISTTSEAKTELKENPSAPKPWNDCQDDTVRDKLFYSLETRWESIWKLDMSLFHFPTTRYLVNFDANISSERKIHLKRPIVDGCVFPDSKTPLLQNHCLMDVVLKQIPKHWSWQDEKLTSVEFHKILRDKDNEEYQEMCSIARFFPDYKSLEQVLSWLSQVYGDQIFYKEVSLNENRYINELKIIHRSKKHCHANINVDEFKKIANQQANFLHLHIVNKYWQNEKNEAYSRDTRAIQWLQNRSSSGKWPDVDDTIAEFDCSTSSKRRKRF